VFTTIHERATYQSSAFPRAFGRTEGPNDGRLISQRARWQRVMPRRRGLPANAVHPRYGRSVGRLPYMCSEVLAPVFEVLSSCLYRQPGGWGSRVAAVSCYRGRDGVGNGLLTNAALLMNERGAHSYPVRISCLCLLRGGSVSLPSSAVAAQAKGVRFSTARSVEKFERNRRGAIATPPIFQEQA